MRNYLEQFRLGQLNGWGPCRDRFRKDEMSNAYDTLQTTLQTIWYQTTNGEIAKALIWSSRSTLWQQKKPSTFLLSSTIVIKIQLTWNLQESMLQLLNMVLHEKLFVYYNQAIAINNSDQTILPLHEQRYVQVIEPLDKFSLTHL